MRKFLLIFAVLILGNFALAKDFVLTGGVDFDWVNMSQIKRDSSIDDYRNAIFSGNENSDYAKKEYKDKYKEQMKDKDYRTHFRLASAEVKKTPDAALCSFFTPKGLLYMYAIQYDKNPEKVYYYDTLGYLRYVDEMSENYPDFPYYSKQYRRSGELAGSIYFISKDTQYVYKPDTSFKGLWYKDKMFDNKAKEILTRTNW